MKKYEIEKILWNQVPSLIPEQWEKLDKESRERIVKKFSSRMYEDWSEFENVFTAMKTREENINFFIYGVFVGITGGLVSDAISKIFEKSGWLGLVSQLLLGVGLSFYLLWRFGKYLRQKNQTTFKSSKLVVSLAAYADKKLQKGGTKNRN